MKYYQLTLPADADFANEVADRINKDYPEQAIIEQQSTFFVVKITGSYWEYCKDYVQKHCKIKS